MVRDAPLSSLFDDDPIPVERPPTCPLCHGDGFDHTPPDLHWSGWCLRCDGRGVQPADQIKCDAAIADEQLNLDAAFDALISAVAEEEEHVQDEERPKLKYRLPR